MTVTPPAENADATLAVVVSRIDDMRLDLADMRREFRESTRAAVSRGEWDQRNRHVDARLDGQGREIGQLRTELSSRRAPWWSTWAVALSAVGLAWSIIGPVLRGAA